MDDRIPIIDKVTYEYSEPRKVRVFLWTRVETEVEISVDWNDVISYTGTDEPDSSELSDYLCGFTPEAMDQVFNDALKRGKTTIVEHEHIEGEEV